LTEAPAGPAGATNAAATGRQARATASFCEGRGGLVFYVTCDVLFGICVVSGRRSGVKWRLSFAMCALRGVARRSGGTLPQPSGQTLSVDRKRDRIVCALGGRA
jgi:hypothetical protein